jgi:phytoene dehydrogenase-like protein
MLAYEDMFDRLRLALRTGPEGDTWRGDSPTREQLSKRLGHDPELISVLFEESIADTLDRYVDDQRMKDAPYGQGVIGAWAGPRDPGTASIKLMHYQGDLLGQGPLWGFVEGGMGQISFAIAQAARDLGATLATGVPVAEILPGEGVRLEGGELIRAGVVVSNADPSPHPGPGRPGGRAGRLPGADRRLAAALAGGQAERRPAPAAHLPGGRRGRVRGPPGHDRRDPRPGRRPGGLRRHRAGRAQHRLRRGLLPDRLRPVGGPAGPPRGQCVRPVRPYTLAEGNWDGRRDQIGRQILDAMAEFAPDLPDCVEDHEVLGPPDIEARIGLTGGHIFQGETMPDQMWEHRLTSRTPVPGLYLCGAATHPAGSVIALNGRNAAMAVLADDQRADRQR